MGKKCKMANIQQWDASTTMEIRRRWQKQWRSCWWRHSQSAYWASEVSRPFSFNGFIILVEEFCIILYPPKACGFATFIWLVLLNLHRQGRVHCILYLYFQLEFYATRLVSSDNWVHEHPFQAESLGPEVVPRRCLPSAEETEHRSLSWHAHPQGIIGHSQPNEPDICGRIPLPGVLDTACPLLRPPAPSAALLTWVTASAPLWDCQCLLLNQRLLELRLSRMPSNRRSYTLMQQKPPAQTLMYSTWVAWPPRGPMSSPEPPKGGTLHCRDPLWPPGCRPPSWEPCQLQGSRGPR